jgi:integrase
VSNLRVALDRVRTGSKIPFAPHDLRRLAATTMERLAVPAYTIRAVLNHVSAATDITGQYVQVDEAMKLDALTKLEGFILDTGKGRKVVALKGARA